MSNKMVTLATFGNPIEAELAKNRLRDEGIQAHLLGDTGGSPFAGVGGLFGHMTLLVQEADAERASRVLAEEESASFPEEEKDTAIKTGEWSHGGSIEENDSETRIRNAAEEIRPLQPVKSDERIQDREAPVSAEAASGTEELEDASEPEVSWTPDAVATRAWRSAVIGLMLLPLVLLSIGTCFAVLSLAVIVYSISLLIALAFMSENVSDKGMKRVYGALIVDGLVVLGIVLFFLSLFFNLGRLLIGPSRPSEFNLFLATFSTFARV